ncbi:zinc-dependent alcohol dehydrogenase, partial [Gordonia sp. VNK21]
AAPLVRRPHLQLARQAMVEAIDFYARGLITPTVATTGLGEINEVFDRMEKGEIDGRMVIDYR